MHVVSCKCVLESDCFEKRLKVASQGKCIDRRSLLIEDGEEEEAQCRDANHGCFIVDV